MHPWFKEVRGRVVVMKSAGMDKQTVSTENVGF